MAVQAAIEKARDIATAAGLKIVGSAIGITAPSYGVNYAGGAWGNSGNYVSQNVSVQPDRSSSGGSDTIALGRISVSACVSMTFKIQ